MTKFTREELQPIFDTLFPNSTSNVKENDWKKLENAGLIETTSITKIVGETEDFYREWLYQENLIDFWTRELIRKLHTTIQALKKDHPEFKL